MFCINSARVFRSPRAEGRKKLLKSLKKQNDMKKTGSKFWLRCAIVFILLMLVNGTLADWCVRRVRRMKKKV